MSSPPNLPNTPLNTPPDLRLRALTRLSGHSGPERARAGASAALGVLHDLASSPATAAKALALLHELQVHQVELELQDEELRNSLVELEADLSRHVQLYDAAPVACFTVDSDTTLVELNLTGAQWLGLEREALPGRALDSFLAPHCGPELRAMLARVGEGGQRDACTLQLMVADGAPRIVHACASADPAGGRFLVVFSEIGSAAGPGVAAAGRTPS